MPFGTTLPSHFLALCRRAALRSHVAAARGGPTTSSVALGPGMRGVRDPPNPWGARRGVNGGSRGCRLQMARMDVVTPSWPDPASQAGIPLLNISLRLPACQIAPYHVFFSTDRTCSDMCECMWTARFSPAGSSLPPTVSALFGETTLFVLWAALGLGRRMCACGSEVVRARLVAGVGHCNRCQTDNGFAKTTYFQRIQMFWSRICVCVRACVSLGISVCVCRGQSRLLEEEHHCLLNFRWTAVSHHFHLAAGLAIFSSWAEALFFPELSYVPGFAQSRMRFVGCSSLAEWGSKRRWVGDTGKQVSQCERDMAT